MKKLLSLAFALVLSISAFSQKTLANDPAHSRIQFEVTHLGINDITGNFKGAVLTINTDDKNFVNSKFSFTVDMNTINTDVEARDNHLKSADFFDVSKYPQMVFKSTSIAKTDVDKKYIMKGDLSLHGITKPVTVELYYRGSTVNPMSKANTYSYQVHSVISRSEFNIGPKFPAPMISDEVRIKGDFELTEK